MQLSSRVVTLAAAAILSAVAAPSALAAAPRLLPADTFRASSSQAAKGKSCATRSVSGRGVALGR